MLLFMGGEVVQLNHRCNQYHSRLGALSPILLQLLRKTCVFKHFFEVKQGEAPGRRKEVPTGWAVALRCPKCGEAQISERSLQRESHGSL
jgi:hypothetical protein